ncbi:MAG: diguanylate cyclase, partial [Candidatus Eremiobacteraeota bacterium]|nr:diguanylate cyclase [Candidatus Eremiobacteraeota bacterium]
LPELENLAPRDFEARFTRDGVERRVAVRLEDLRGGPYARYAAILASIEPIDEAAPAAGNSDTDSETRRVRRLESLWNLIVRRGFVGAQQVKALLREGATGLSLERASLARLDGDELVVEFAYPGEDGEMRVPLERSLSQAALTRSGTFAVLDTRTDAEFSRVASDVRCFIASAFRAGDVRWVLTFSSAVARQLPFDDGDWVYVDQLVEALARGIERTEREMRVERLAYSDSLTALPNRISVLSRLDEALAQAEQTGTRAAVLFLDIDGFKNVNDTVGHRGGDVVLAEVAQRLRGTLRLQEYIGRLGGDEFAIVVPHFVDRDEIESIAQRVGGVLTFPFAVEEERFSLSASIGVAIYPDDATGRDDLLACADAAMYAAKEEGGARLRFRETAGAFEDGRSDAPAVVAGRAVEAGYVLCYQPILNLHTGRVSSAEALIRRVHRRHGLLAPERGWSIAHDEAGRRALDRWVLREATTQAQEWKRAGSPIRIDVNLAGFDAREIDAMLADEMLASDVGRIRIEIDSERFAESEHQRRFGDFVDYCAKKGFGFALDRFDGGLGVLASLSNLPIDAVKLERALVETVLTSRTARAIVQGTIIVAKSLGWSVIAKGV